MNAAINWLISIVSSLIVTLLFHKPQNKGSILMATTSAVDINRFRFKVLIKDAAGLESAPSSLGVIIAVLSDQSIATVTEDPAAPGQFLVSPISQNTTSSDIAGSITFTSGSAAPDVENFVFTPGPATSLIVTVSVEPVPVSIPPGAVITFNVGNQSVDEGSAFQFIATVSVGGVALVPQPAIVWSVLSGTGDGSPATGSIDQNGFYAAPAVGTAPGADHVIATVAADPSITNFTAANYS